MGCLGHRGAWRRSLAATIPAIAIFATTLDTTLDAPTGAGDGRRAHVEEVRELLTRKISVRCKDGRHVVGDFMCLDPQGNIVLYNAHEYRAGAEGDTTMGGTQVILVPYDQQTDEVTLLG